MKKIFLFMFAVGLFLVSCGGEVVKEEEKEALSAHDFFINGEEYYLFYPENANVVGERIEFVDDPCPVVNFGNFERLKDIAGGREDLSEVDISERNGAEIWTVEGEKVLYGRSVRNKDFGVWAFVDAEDVSSCTDYVDFIFESLTEKISYMRKQYGFDIFLPEEFEAEYYEHGIFLRRKNVYYDMGIGIKSFENEGGFVSVGDYVGSEYPGYDIGFMESEGVSGYYVDKADGEGAARHFFTLSYDGKIIVEVYMKLPGMYFSERLGEFESLLGTLRIF